MLAVFEGKGWMRNFEIRDALEKMMPELQIDKRTLIRYLKAQVEMGNLEKITEPGKTRYRLSNKGGITQLASMIHASMKVQSHLYPDLQKGCLTLEIRKGKEFWGLLLVLQEDMRTKFGERWKDEVWGKMVSRGTITFINECVQPKPTFIQKIPETDLFFFKPPLKLYEIMTSAVLSGDYETEADVIIHAMNEWKDLREKRKLAPISLERFPCVKSAVDKGIFKTPKEAVMEALNNMEAQMRGNNHNQPVEPNQSQVFAAPSPRLEQL